MGQLSRFLRSGTDGSLFYWCQGCEEIHQVKVGEGPGPRWGYNGNPEKPTFTPSVLTTWDGRSAEARERAIAFHKEHGRPPSSAEIPLEHHVCHTFITDGMVQFLGDCTHARAGKTEPLPELPQAYIDKAEA